MKKTAVVEFHASKGSSEPVMADIELELVEMPDFSEEVDGAYVVTVTGGVASYTPIEVLPDNSGLGDGNYQLTMTGGVPSWTLIV